MSLHNSVHNSDHGDDYIEDPGRVTLISKLDISDPLYLHPNDSTVLTIILVKLKGTENYQVWSCAMLLALKGENQQMTYTDKELDNVLDISHLKINVGHPNGTETFISKIGNLKLSNCLVLYDVFVIPEYCVTLISVPRLAKENKHDWHCRLDHPAEPVLNMLK
ncbi:ribonuclease H-like domain-containing protein [Tanacetum coccineum]|uniref:Ribonuclease H-like domain-containing protein n=1 Tax=Tanacetum coccineum TaxID=301880 RepID=A0ABQ5C3V0_9ASTR